ncbi:glycosyltransferase family 2 protein [Hymenobacter arizonensis]|uniref:Glycosyltransferase involved in cell wall bisynthesis n=1 Tax=Hymenobacter arizonensis TaxID=1227077 RepID=A0A1I6BRN1_HYMAR|nr:glycosyltransferase family 2 protein [Hymenobacter arizonensis]SFQ83583.1 Glycosyltransferase involved in cell wall bisynthesis [Hymenobacter arizonensis]
MKLSVITINYNNAADLTKTLHSVFEQTWTDFEYIVIDGGSTDGSLEVIRQNEGKLAYWVSEPDAGIYNAMNKGIRVAEGDYLLMLNAGDSLCNNTVLEQVFSLNTYNEDILAGDVYRAVNGKIFDKSCFPDTLTFGFLRSGTLSHQAAFIKKRLHNVVGMYDEHLNYSSDWKFFILAICKYNASYRHLPFFISICDATGLTSIPENFHAMNQEIEQILNQDFAAFVPDYVKFDSWQQKTLKHKISLAWPFAKKSIKKLIKRYQ